MSKTIISYEKLLEIPLEDIRILCNSFVQKKIGFNVYCVELVIYSKNESIARDCYSYRNFSEFKTLFENFTEKNPDEKFPEFPSRFGFSKTQDETRKKYFHMFLNRVLEKSKGENKSEENLCMLYNFIFGFKDAGSIKLDKERIKAVFNIDVENSDIVDNDFNELNKTAEEIQQSNISDANNSSNNNNNNSALSFSKIGSNILELLNSDNKLATLEKMISSESNKENNLNTPQISNFKGEINKTNINNNNNNANIKNININNNTNNTNNKNNNMDSNSNNTNFKNNSESNNNNNNNANNNIINTNNNTNNNIKSNNYNININKPVEKESYFSAFKRNSLNYVNEKFNLFLGNKDKAKKENKDIKENKENKEKETKDNKEGKGLFYEIRKSISSKKAEKYTEENNTWENILVKTSLKDYCLHKIKIKDKCLFLTYEDYNYHNNIINEEEENIEKKISDEFKENHFYLVIPLYKINIELYRIIYPPLLSDDKTLKSIPEYYKKVRINSSEIYELQKFSPSSSLSDINSEIILKLYHDYDRFETCIKFGQDWKISAIKNCLSKIEESLIPNKIKSVHIDEIIESNMDSFGNILIDIMEFSAPYFRGKIRVKISLDPYTLNTKSIISNASFKFNQKFLIPKHNRFKYLKFNVYKIKEGGIINKKDVEKLIAYYEIPLPKLINVYHLNKDPIEINLIPSKEKAKKKKLKYTEMKLKFKFIDYTYLLGILVKNTNKRILDSYPLYNKDGDSEEPYTITILLKRIKRVLNMFKNIYSFYCMLKFFKYPVISSIFWLVLLYYTFLCDPKFYMTHWIVFIISILFYYSSVFQYYLYPKLKPILFYIRNKYDNPSKLAVTESQKNKAEVAQSDYLIKKKGFYIPSIKEIKEYKHTYIDLLFRLSRIASFCEKFKNLFLWTDPLLSFYMLVLLFLFCLVTWKIEFRFLLCFSVSKKLFFGIFYYKNKLINNIEIARIVINDAFEIWRAEKLAKLTKEKEKEKKEKEKKEKEKEKKEKEKEKKEKEKEKKEKEKKEKEKEKKDKEKKEKEKKENEKDNKEKEKENDKDDKEKEKKEKKEIEKDKENKEKDKKEKEKEKKDKEKEKKEKEKEKKEKEITTIMEKKSLDDEKLKNILKHKLYEHSNIILNEKFFDKMETLGDVIEELGKVEDILKIKRLSPLYKYTKNNPKIFQKDIDPEDIFAYFVQNIKSDYYMAQNGFIQTDYFKNENIIEEEIDIKKEENITRSVSGKIPKDLLGNIEENKIN